MKSRDSYNRIINQYDKNNVEWEEHVTDIDYVKSKFTVTEFDCAVIDNRLWWKDDAVEFFNKNNVHVILFQGDFDDIYDKLTQYCSPQNDPDDDILENQVLDSSTNFTNIKEELNDSFIDKTVKVEVPVYKSVYAGIPNQLVLVANLSSRAGSTFVTLSLAKLLSNLQVLTCVIEPPIDKPYIFDTVGIDVKYKSVSVDDNSEFISYPHLINENKKVIKDKEFIYDGIIWLVADARKPFIPDWDYYKMMKLIYASKRASTYLVDCGSHLDHKSIRPIVNEADLVLIVVDPMPTECMQNEALLEELFEMKKSGLPIEFVVNRYSNGVNKEQLNDYLRVSPLCYIPTVDSKYIHEAIYNYKLPMEMKNVAETLDKPLYYIIKKLIPSELLHSYFSASETTKTNKFNIFNLIRRKQNR